MNIEYDLQKLDEALYDFYRVTGVSITFYDKDISPIVQKSTRPTGYCTLISSIRDGAAACAVSNLTLLRMCSESGEPVRHVCAAGLTDIAVPLIHADEILGYLMLGQIRMKSEFPEIQFDLGDNRAQLEELYSELHTHSEEEVTAIMHIAVMLTKYILLENMIKPRHNGAADAITSYINAHLTEKLTVEKIAKNVFLSPSGIYKAINKHYGCTVSEYISRMRIELSLPLLRESEYSVEDIAARSGFSSPAYFSRIFKKCLGVSPLQYRASNKE